MAGVVCSEESLAAKLAAVLPHLDKRLRRLVMGAEARALGHGGIKVVARAAGVSAVTVSKVPPSRWPCRLFGVDRAIAVCGCSRIVSADGF